MALASNVSLALYAGRIPLLAGALECVRAGHIPAGLKNNREFAECLVQYDDGVPDEIRTLLFDPQTAGGLLMAVKTHGNDWVSKLNAAGIPAVQIGEVLPESKPRILVTN
jgi:selenide,water dikinase